MSGFVIICVFLAALYGIYATISITQIVRVSYRDNFTLRSWICPQTVQQQVFLLVLIISCFRVAFFLVAIYAWNSDLGEVTSHKVAFYSLDEYATIFFYSLTSALTLFWADIYYLSIQNEAVFTTFVRPAIYFVNIAALIAVGFCCYYVIDLSNSDVDYTFISFSIIISVVYIIGAIMFGFYARMAAAELKDIPVIISVRKKRMKILRIIAIVFVLALLVKAASLIAISGSTIITKYSYVLVLMVIFYCILELFPMATVLAFYQVDQITDSSTGEDSEHSMAERQPLNASSPGSRHGIDYDMWSFYNSPRKPSATADNVEALINRLSVDG